jgi:lipopolysaccharide transport system ATP-binding protein
MPEPIINVEHLGKSYLLQHENRQRYQSLRDEIVKSAQTFWRDIRYPHKRQKRRSQENFWALQDVSFAIQPGERIGIIGRNGAGKSTLLKILSRITEPTQGRVAIRGRVASLLEVGTGFHPELSGRENIFLNGAILGMTRLEILRKFSEIVEFAEVEKFLDTPVKHYSSGMYVRLAFAVAAHLEPEILVVDEVLAVGDAEFQKKCLGKMEDVAAKDGRTVLLVSHNMMAIRTLCSKSLLLSGGKIQCYDTVDRCLSIYESKYVNPNVCTWERKEIASQESLVILGISCNLLGQQPVHVLEISVLLESVKEHKSAFIAVDVLDSSGGAIMQAIPLLQEPLAWQRKSHNLKISIQLPPLIPGVYLASVWVGSHNSETLDWVKEAVSFEITESPIPNRTFPYTRNHGFMVPISSCVRI